MNVLKTTTLLTLMTVIVIFTAQALGFDLIFSLFFAFIFNFIMYFYSSRIALASTRARKLEEVINQMPSLQEETQKILLLLLQQGL